MVKESTFPNKNLRDVIFGAYFRILIYENVAEWLKNFE